MVQSLAVVVLYTSIEPPAARERTRDLEREGCCNAKELRRSMSSGEEEARERDTGREILLEEET